MSSDRPIIRLGHVDPTTDPESDDFKDFVKRRAAMSNTSLEQRVVKISPSGEVEVFGKDVEDLDVSDGRL